MDTEPTVVSLESTTTSSNVEFSQVYPEVILPTYEMVTQGKQDFRNIFETFPEGITPKYDDFDPRGFRSLLLSPDYHPVRGCFMGFNAHASQLSGLLRISEAEAVRRHVASLTEGRMDAAIIEVSVDPEMANFHLINQQEARRIMSALATVFPANAASNPTQWIGDIIRNRDKTRDTYLGLLSGFPPVSVGMYGKPSVGTKTLPGIGTFHYFGTESENRFIQYARDTYTASDIDSLVSELKSSS